MSGWLFLDTGPSVPYCSRMRLLWSRRGPATDSSVPWRAVVRRLQRLEWLQLGVLIVVSVGAVGITVGTALAGLRAADERKAEQEVQNSLLVARDNLRLQYGRHLERLRRGEPGVGSEVVSLVRAGERFFGALIENDRTAEPPERAAGVATLDVTRRVLAYFESVEGRRFEVGSAAERVHEEEFGTLAAEMVASLDRWIARNGAQLAESESTSAARTRALVVWLPIGIGLLAALGVIGWLLIGRARRRMSATLEDVAGEQSTLREIATLVAAASDPAEVFDAVAQAAARILCLPAGVVTLFRDGAAHRVGAWSVAERVGDGPLRAVDLSGPSATALVYRTKRAARTTYAKVPNDIDTQTLSARGLVASVAVPVFLGSELWGAVAAASAGEPILPGAEERLSRLAELVAVSLKTAEERQLLAERATTDSLTGLANHRAFQERLRAEVERAVRHDRGLALVLMDLDHFKEINDTHGHQAGDEVLAESARRLSQEVRGSELLARIGGEEFAWLLPEADGLEAWQAAERARAAVGQKPFPGVGTIMMSAGVCDIYEAGGSAPDLFRFADGALYRAKTQGRNATYRYTPEVVPELAARGRAERLVRTQVLTALQALARAVDARDPSARRHSERVANLAVHLAVEMGWTSERADAVRQAGLMHDVGKLAVPDAILLKPGPLTAPEFEVIKEHAARGAEIVLGVLSPEQVSWVRHHHERWDGQGYPDGLRGEQIPDGAMVLALADAWDAMTTERSYSHALSEEEALVECRRFAGEQFDAEVVDALVRLMDTGRAFVATGDIGEV